MQLRTALRLQPGQTVAFTGAGGKSSAIRHLVAEIAPESPMLVSTTTRFGLEQADLATHHLAVAEGADLAGLVERLEQYRSVLVTGPALEAEGKWLGIEDPEQLQTLHRAASSTGAVLLLEADGARGRSLKAPAQHEPVVPGFTDLLVPVAALDAVGQRLSSDFVHRPDRVADLLRASNEAALQPEHLAQVLSHEEGGLKGLPGSGQVRVLLNKAGEGDRLAAGREIAGALLDSPRIHGVLLSQLAADPPVLETHGRIAGIVLAAGGSSRLGFPKQLIPFRGRPLVWHAVQTAIEAGLSPVVVVCGAAAAGVRMALEEARVTIVDNPDWEAGQSTSVRLGLATAEQSPIEGAIFLLVDMPLVTETLVGELLKLHRSSLAPLIAPRAGGRRANPVLFDRTTFPTLLALEGDRGGRALFDRYEAVWLEWDESAMLDLDTAADLERLRALE